MALRTSTPIDALAAPPGDGEDLIWPAPGRLARLIEENRTDSASNSVNLLDRPMSTWRTASGQEPIIFTGHQPAFFHPGVWAKNVVATALAKRIGGRAVFLAVDSDAPDRLALEWPREKENHYENAAAALFPSLQGRCYEQFPPLSSSLRKAFMAQLGPEMTRDAKTPLPAFLSAFCGKESPNDKGDYISTWAAGMNAIDRTVDVSSPTIERVSDRFAVNRTAGDIAAIALVSHILLKAESFAAAYNGALADYRTARGIKGDRHPIPDLLVTAERIELPFWILGTESRRRLFISRVPSTSDAIQLWAGSEAIGAVARKNLLRDPSTAMRDDLGSPQIRPRALALTIYSRLLACDLFIHGIGGAKYDQITDEIIRRFFGCKPPAYACISATMRLPLRRHPVTRDDEHLCRHRLRDLQYNPQRYVNGDADVPRLAAMIVERDQAISQSERLRIHHREDHAARRNAYHAIRRANGALLATAGNLPLEFQREAASISAALDQNRIVDNREWFIGLYPTSRLIELSDKLVRKLH